MISMLNANYLIVGSGLSAFICSSIKKESKILTNLNHNHLINKSFNFYEYNNLGGNTNVWGGYINLDILEKLKKQNSQFSKFIDNNFFFEISSLSNKRQFKNVGFIKEKNSNKIFRINKKLYENKLINFELKKIIIKKEYLILQSVRNSFKAKKINLCIGNLGLLKVLYSSNIINNNDIISFTDGKVKYGLNFNLKKINYYIPMSPFQIIEKIIFDKSLFYNKSSLFNNLIVQIFDTKQINYNYKIAELLSMSKSLNLRFFLTNHVTNLKINNIPINEFINKKTNRIIINCSGIIKEHIMGPISQNVIYNSYINS